MKISTKILHTGVEIDAHTGAVSLPIYPASTYHQHSIDKPGEYEYIRSGNPTRQAVEKLVASLENGSYGFAFASGMAAISSVLMLLSPGNHILAPEELYGGTYRALTRLFSRFQIETTFIDMSDAEVVKKAIRPNTRAIYIETPSNPLFRITDLKGMAKVAKENNLFTIADNTFMTPYLQRPLDLGIDISVHSATKFLGGHSDLLAGVVVVKDKGLANEIKFVQNAFGAVLSPHDSWLLMRGIKTLKVRLEQQQASAIEIARWLCRCPEVVAVYYPGLPDHPGRALHRRQASGSGGILSFRLKNKRLAKKVMTRVKLPVVAVSLGAVESILTYPWTMSHAAIPVARRRELGIDEDLLRLSVGIEAVEDLIEDLKQDLEG
jgi:cystathionine beta-lyase/cystathionine gamma-synthase